MTEIYFNWKTTPGVGDFMMGLNIAYRRHHRGGMPVTINFHWYHDRDHYHHCEDPETILERFDYIHNFYLNKGSIKIDHTFNSTYYLPERWEFKKDGVPLDFTPRYEKSVNHWSFDQRSYLPTDKNKVVIWRPMMNAEEPRLWKRRVTNEEWQLIIDNLVDLGYNVVELEYKTPVSEVVYHINTCAFTVSYDGMWHYVAKNFWKPMIVFSNDAITGYNTKHALRISSKKTLLYSLNLNSKANIEDKLISPYDRMMEKAEYYRDDFWEWLAGMDERCKLTGR